VANEYIGHVTIPYNMTNVAPGRSANQIAVFTRRVSGIYPYLPIKE
jgi:hypothetical protein